MNLIQKAVSKHFDVYWEEDELGKNLAYFKDLPGDIVEGKLLVKSEMIIAGLPYFFAAFNSLMDKPLEFALNDWEGRKITQYPQELLSFQLPFNVALTAERLALNLLQRASSIATYTNKFVDKAENYNIAILDTRKTTPGLRALEKYAVNIGGGNNHRFGQNDVFMVKDNHKSFFKGLKNAVNFFKNQKSFYTPIIVEIHSIDELKEAIELKVQHIMLDNFTPEQIIKAIKIKPDGMTFEVSGGISLETIGSYLIEGVDAISVGSLTHNVPSVDLSFKYKKVDV